MAKQENTAINNLVHLVAGGRSIEGDPGADLFSMPAPGAAMRGGATPRPAPWDGRPTVAFPRSATDGEKTVARPAPTAPDSMLTIARPAPTPSDAVETVRRPKQPAPSMDDEKTVARAAPPRPPAHGARSAHAHGHGAPMAAHGGPPSRAVASPGSARGGVERQRAAAPAPIHHDREQAPQASVAPTRRRAPAGTPTHYPPRPVTRDPRAIAPTPLDRARELRPRREAVDPRHYARAAGAVPSMVPAMAVPAMAAGPAMSSGHPGAFVVASHASARRPDPTAIVSAMPPPLGQRPFLVELFATLKEFALPITMLVLCAAAFGGYRAYAAKRDRVKPRSVPAVAAAPSAPASTPTPSSALSAAVISADPSLAPAEHVPSTAPSAAVPSPESDAATATATATGAATATATATDAATDPATATDAATDPATATATVPAAQLASEGAAAVASDEDDEIEMKVTSARKDKKKRTARRHRSALEVALAEDAAATKRVAVAKPASTRSEKAAAKRAGKVDEAELPPNVADKTDGGPGKIVVTSDVPALIYIDGRNTNLTTPKKITVPAGKHKITLLDPETRKAKTQDVEVIAGKTATIEKQFH